MFAYADNFYNGAVATAAHFLMSATLVQVGGMMGGERGGGRGRQGRHSTQAAGGPLLTQLCRV
jgi:hypothetical protein